MRAGALIGPEFTRIEGLAVDADGQIYVTDDGTDDPRDEERLLRVDPMTGDRTIVADHSTGTGPDFSTNPGWYRMRFDRNGQLVVVGDKTQHRIDPATGNREVVSEEDIGGGPEFDEIEQVAIGLGGDYGLTAVWVLALTGEIEFKRMILPVFDDSFGGSHVFPPSAEHCHSEWSHNMSYREGLV